MLALAASWTWLGAVSGLIFGFAGLVVGPWKGWAAIPAVLGGLGLLLEVAAKREFKSQTAEMKALMHSCMQPLVRSLIVLASKTTKQARVGPLDSVLWATLTAAISLTRTDGSRASFFVREQGSDVLVPHPTLSTGRGDAPISRFARGSGEGVEVWRAALAGEVTFYENLLTSPPLGMDRDRARSYQTFITAPIETNGNLVGLLTINAPRPGDLTEDDRGVMRVLATLVGVALTICGGAWADDGR